MQGNNFTKMLMLAHREWKKEGRSVTIRVGETDVQIFEKGGSYSVSGTQRVRPKPARTFTEKVSKTDFSGELIGGKWLSSELSKRENDAFDAFMKANARVAPGEKNVAVSKQGDARKPHHRKRE